MENILNMNEGKLRIIQETVPGKQVTLAQLLPVQMKLSIKNWA